MTVIIVDDDALICRSLELVLSKESDIEVLGTAVTGSEAAWPKDKTRMLLMDSMPEMDGFRQPA